MPQTQLYSLLLCWGGSSNLSGRYSNILENKTKPAELDNNEDCFENVYFCDSAQICLLSCRAYVLPSAVVGAQAAMINDHDREY